MNRITVLASAAIGLAWAMPAAAQERAKLSLGGSEFTIPVPAGYCIPIGEAAERMAFAASVDTASVTLASFVSCGPKADRRDYYLVKAPKDPLNRDLTFAQYVTAEFDGAENIPIPDAEKKVGDALSKRAGSQVAISTAITTRGRDEACGYIGGLFEADSGGGTKTTMTLAGCATVLAKRAIHVIVYNPGSDISRVPALKAQVKAVVKSIKPTSAP
jgi:hypothetical protein